MTDSALRELHEAVETLNNQDSLKILKIDEDVLGRPDTTLEYIDRYRAWTQLLNISKSIPDLISQSASPPLVGFLGHFSSGKSSLINAILRVSSPGASEYAREVDVHPTDTQITLIAHPSQSQIVKKSAYTTIDQIAVESGPASGFLEHAILVDTPGLGNEDAEHEAVTRFLHLCHVLVITIDGRRPFADKEKDFALLDTAFNKLEGVPKILVVTSAEEFLSSRMGRFDTDWQVERAEAFWETAIQRLRSDARFQDHLHRFEMAPRFFVDSKDGFQVDQVVGALLPIVRDDAQQARIRKAQARYVMATAEEALRTLLGYISARSARLNRLHVQAQDRARGTATAVEELLEVLESSFTGIRERLREARKAAPAVAFAVDTTVTPQAIGQHHQEALEAVRREVRAALKQRLSEVRSSVRRRARLSLRRRTRPWLLRKGPADFRTDLDVRFRLDGAIPGLVALAEDCAQSMVRLVNQQLATTVAGLAKHLSDTSEAWTIGSVTHEIKSALERFQHKHDDSIRGFYAHMSLPRSSDLLREHGVIGFDDSGEPAVEIERIRAAESARFTEISESSERSKDGLRGLSQESSDRGADLALDGLDTWVSLDGGPLGEDYPKSVMVHINSVCQRTFDEFASALSQYMDGLVVRSEEARESATETKRRIWSARATLAVRSVGVGVVLVLVLLLLSASDYSATVMSVLEDNLTTVIVSLVTALGIPALLFLISGAKNETVRTAIRPAVRQTWHLLKESRALVDEMGIYFDRSYDRMVDGVDGIPLAVDEALARGIVESILSTHHEAHEEVSRLIGTARAAVRARRRLFDEYGGVVEEALEEIPGELHVRSIAIKNDTIETHLDRIRDATRAVDSVKSDVEKVAEIAARHSGSTS